MSSPAALPPSSPPSPAAATPEGWWAVCLCAAWCGTCGIYRPLFNELARAHPDVRFEWVDIEDESDLAGDLDVETFPTLLIADGQRAVPGSAAAPGARAGAAAGQPAGRSRQRRGGQRGPGRF